MFKLGAVAFVLGSTLFIGATGSLLSLSFANGFFVLLTHRISLRWHLVIYILLGISIWQIWLMVFGLCCYDYDVPEQLIYDISRMLGTVGGISCVIGTYVCCLSREK